MNITNSQNTILKLSTLLILWVVAFYPIYPELFETWLNHSNNSHGLLVPLISIYFIWQQREKLNSIQISSSQIGMVILVISMLFYLISYAGGIAFVSRAMIVFSIIGIVLFTLGWKLFKIVAFPLLFLLFMVPVPTSVIGLVAFPLQLFATNIAAFIIKIVSIPVYQEGNMLYFAQTQLEVAEACSGIRSIMALMMLSVIFVYLTGKGLWRKIIILASAIPIALLANIIRVSGTGILAHFYGDKVARGFLHEFSGMVVFAFGFIILVLEYTFLNKFSSSQ